MESITHKLNSFFTLGLVGLLCFSWTSQSAWSAPCCSRTAAAPFLILGDDEAQLSLGYSYSGLAAKADRDGMVSFIPSQRTESVQSVKLDGAFLISDRLQSGVSLPLVRNSLATGDLSGSSMGLGDVRLSIGYEYLTAWTYSSWKPQGYLFSVIALPTGRSSYESQSNLRTDITGNGFYSLAVGTILFKRWSLWDAFLLPEFHYSLPRTFQTSGATLRAIPGFGGSIGIGIGYSPGGGAFRLGARVQPKLDQGLYSAQLNTPLEAQGQNRGGTIANCDTGVDLSYMVTDHNTVMMSYTDQTLLGVAMNTNLNRMLAVSFQHRMPR